MECIHIELACIEIHHFLNNGDSDELIFKMSNSDKLLLRTMFLNPITTPRLTETSRNFNDCSITEISGISIFGSIYIVSFFNLSAGNILHESYISRMPCTTVSICLDVSVVARDRRLFNGPHSYSFIMQNFCTLETQADNAPMRFCNSTISHRRASTRHSSISWTVS